MQACPSRPNFVLIEHMLLRLLLSNTRNIILTTLMTNCATFDENTNGAFDNSNYQIVANKPYWYCSALVGPPSASALRLPPCCEWTIARQLKRNDLTAALS